MAEVLAIAAPTTEEMTRIAVAGGGAGVTGGIVGVIAKVAPQLGALEPLVTWGALLGIPIAAAGAAMFTKGILSDLSLGAACGSIGVIGYTLPELLAPITGRKAPGNRSSGQGLLPPGTDVKQLTAGPLGAPQRAQQAGVKSALEF